MFQNLKKLFIYLLLLPWTFTFPINGNHGYEITIPDVDEAAVKEEMLPFTTFLNMISDDTEKGKFIGKLEMLARKAAKAAAKADLLLINQGHLESQKNEADKYRLLLGLTYRIDYLESTLAPGLDFKGKQRRVRWSTIFNLKTPAVEKFKKKVEDAGMTEVAFAECIERLCNERNNRAGHAKISLPKIVNEKTIEDALAIMEITDDKPVVETIKIIVAPVEGLDLTITTTTKNS